MYECNHKCTVCEIFMKLSELKVPCSTAKRIGRTDTHVSDRAIICELNLQIADSHKKIVINVDDLVKI